MAEYTVDGPGGPDADAGRVVFKSDGRSVFLDVTDFATGHGFAVPLSLDDMYEIIRLLDDAY